MNAQEAIETEIDKCVYSRGKKTVKVILINFRFFSWKNKVRRANNRYVHELRYLFHWWAPSSPHSMNDFCGIRILLIFSLSVEMAREKWLRDSMDLKVSIKSSMARYQLARFISQVSLRCCWSRISLKFTYYSRISKLVIFQVHLYAFRLTCRSYFAVRFNGLIDF